MAKKIFFLNLTLLCFALTNAQVQIHPAPEEGYQNRIKTFIENLKVIDTHEHLIPQNKLNESTSYDFILLLAHYSNSDIISSGLPQDLFKIMMKDSLSTEKKWEIIKPYWENSFNTAYCRNALYASHNLFGIDSFDDISVITLSDRIKEAYKNENWFYDVLDKANIEWVIQDGNDRSFRDDKFRYAIRFDHFVNIRSRNHVDNLSKRQKIDIRTLNDLLAALDKSFATDLSEKIVGVKTGLAYSRILHYENVERKIAEEVFNKLMNENVDFDFANVKPLQDFMMHRVIQNAKSNNLPVIIHTGLQTGSGNIIKNSKPTHLVNLFLQYPEVRFVLYHGSYPYGGELSTIAKNFSNVYIDLCWLYIISPSYAERYLHEWLETVPVNKIMGFGGDFRNIENTYGHLYFAKQIISKVLIEKVSSRYFSESEAKKIANMILYENAKNFYNL